MCNFDAVNEIPEDIKELMREEDDSVEKIINRIAGFPPSYKFADQFMEAFPMSGETPSTAQINKWSRKNNFYLNPVECKYVSLSIGLAKVFAGKQ